MRQIYASPRSENIDRAVALLATRGIQTRVLNRSGWKRPSHQRFSYQSNQEQREDWPQVWVLRASDYAAARSLLRELAIEPTTRHGEELKLARRGNQRSSSLAARMRRIALLAVGLVFALVMLRYLHGG